MRVFVSVSLIWLRGGEDVVNLHQLRLARLYPHVGQHWHETLAKGLELLPSPRSR